MNEKTKQFTQAKMQEALALHIWKNDHLRDEIMKNPKDTIERELNVKFDDEVKVGVVNHTQPNQATFVLPYNIHEGAGHELSDDELEEVAGGFKGRDIKKFVKKHGGEIGGYTGVAVGTGIQVVGMAYGVPLPNTGLGKPIGTAVGKAIGNAL